MRMVRAQDKPKAHLETHAPQCPRCKMSMRERKRIPLGGKFDDVDYRCDKCGAEVTLRLGVIHAMEG
jgi:transposase-like protein